MLFRAVFLRVGTARIRSGRVGDGRIGTLSCALRDSTRELEGEHGWDHPRAGWRVDETDGEESDRLRGWISSRVSLFDS